MVKITLEVPDELSEQLAQVGDALRQAARVYASQNSLHSVSSNHRSQLEYINLLFTNDLGLL